MHPAPSGAERDWMRVDAGSCRQEKDWFSRKRARRDELLFFSRVSIFLSLSLFLSTPTSLLPVVPRLFTATIQRSYDIESKEHFSIDTWHCLFLPYLRHAGKGNWVTWDAAWSRGGGRRGSWHGNDNMGRLVKIGNARESRWLSRCRPTRPGRGEPEATWPRRRNAFPSSSKTLLVGGF